MPLAFFSLIALFQRKLTWAVLTAGLAFNLHPGLGLICLIVVLIQAGLGWRTASLRDRAMLLALVALTMLPNLTYMLASVGANFRPTDSQGETLPFYDQLRIYANHMFIEDHWRDGYGWFALLFAVSLSFLRVLDRRRRSLVIAVIATLFVIMAAYTANVYIVKYKGVLIMFLFRATVFLSRSS